LFQSALRMRGLFNYVGRTGLGGMAMVSIRLADAWPFQRGVITPWSAIVVVSIRLADAWPFQRRLHGALEGDAHVSIRLADAWPFQHCARQRRD